MEKDILISIKLTQQDEENNVENIEFMTNARFNKKDNTYYIIYEETEVTGMEGTKTTIKFNSEIVKIIRFGKVSSNLIFQAGQQHVSNYNTGYGSLEMKVTTKEMQVEANESRVMIHLNYIIELSGQVIGENQFILKTIKNN